MQSSANYFKNYIQSPLSCIENQENYQPKSLNDVLSCESQSILSNVATEKDIDKTPLKKIQEQPTDSQQKKYWTPKEVNIII